MRHIPDSYIYGNPFLEVASLDALLTPVASEDDGTPLEIPDSSADGEARLAESQEAAAVRDFVDGLPERDRDLIQRIFWNDETQADVARAFNVSAAAISKRLARIVARGRMALSALRPAPLLH